MAFFIPHGRLEFKMIAPRGHGYAHVHHGSGVYAGWRLCLYPTDDGLSSVSLLSPVLFTGSK